MGFEPRLPPTINRFNFLLPVPDFLALKATGFPTVSALIDELKAPSNA